MVTLADKSMLPQLITLWQKSFGDSTEYIRMFLDWNFDRIKTIVYVTEADPVVPVSVAYLLPVTFVQKGKQDIPCWYLYAAATSPECRGRGYFAEILKFVEEKLPEPMILVPGEESLISYYEKQGLHVWLQERKQYLAEANWTPQKEMCVSDISREEYIEMRNYILASSSDLHQKGYMNWNEQFLQYICHENQFCGGEIKCITIEDKDFLVMYRVENEVLKVLELLPGINGDECISGLITAVNDSLLSERCNQKCNAAEVMLQPNVMATAKLEAASNRGYFNLIMA